jgi:hypothetical protein
MSDNSIQVGDKVFVNFHNCEFTLCADGEVVHIPNATGDSWVIKDSKKGFLHYISEGCTITKAVE